MIKKLTGRVDFIKDNFIILNVNGVGYQVFLGSLVLDQKVGLIKTFYTHCAIRETSWDIYGFNDFDQLSVFELLLTINGVGPKAALGIMDVTTPASLKKAVLTENKESLTKVSGIGSKVASKIILELKNKIDKIEIKDSDSSDFDLEIYETLEALGFSRLEIRKALEGFSDQEDMSTEEKIKQALKFLAK